MKTSSFFSYPYHALILQVVGLILILGTLVDYLILAVPPNFGNSDWASALIGEWVLRGTLPLLGLAVLFLGVWFERNHLETARWKVAPILAFCLSALFGLLFLVLAPLYFYSSGLSSVAQADQINQQATQTTNQFNQLLEQQRDQVNAIVSNEDQLKQLQQQINSVDNSSLSEDQKVQLKQIRSTLDKVKSDPKALDQEVEKARTKGTEQIKQKQQEALGKIQSQLWHDRLRITISSLLFAIGYLSIAWIGLRSSRDRSSR